MATKPSSQVSQNYVRECEMALERQVDLEFYASYTYLSMAYYFSGKDIALKNFSAYFLKLSCEILQQAETLQGLHIQRGGRILPCDIRTPEDYWGSGLHAIEYAFHLEQRVHQSLLDLHQLATDHGDTQLCEFLESHLLYKQVRTIKELDDHVINVSKLEAQKSSLADYFFDRFNWDDSDKDKGNGPGSLV